MSEPADGSTGDDGFDEADWEAAAIDDEGGEEAEDRDPLGNAGEGAGEPWRVSADIAQRVGVWKGVRSCSDADRAVAAMQPHFDQWVAATIAAHPDRRPLFKGYSGHRWWKNKTHSSGKRSCKGGWTHLTAYVDFE